MRGLLDLTNSERGLAAGMLVIGATVLCALGKMSVDDWRTYTTGIFVIYAGGKTASSVAGILKGKGQLDGSR